MITNGKLRDFVLHVIAKGQITLGDVRRLQRGYLPSGVTNRDDLEILISLNAKLARADKAWAQWLASVVADFVTTGEARERPFEGAAGKWIERLLAVSTTKPGLRIARQIRRELARLRAIRSTSTEEAPPHDAQESLDCSTPPRDTGRHEAIPRTIAFTATAGWCLANYVRNRSDFMNFEGSRVSLVLAPCR